MKAKGLLEEDEDLNKLLEYDKEKDKDRNDLVTLRDSKKNSPCLMFIIVLTYKIFKYLYKGVYFYFLPFLIIPVSYSHKYFKSQDQTLGIK
jgi:hypothetical protein